MDRTITLPSDPEKATGLEGRVNRQSFNIPRSVTVQSMGEKHSHSPTREHALKRQNSVSFVNGPQRGDTASRIVGEFRYVSRLAILLYPSVSKPSSSEVITMRPLTDFLQDLVDPRYRISATISRSTRQEGTTYQRSRRSRMAPLDPRRSSAEIERQSESRSRP